MMYRYVIGISLLFSAVSHASPICPFEKWDVYQGAQLLREQQSGAYLFSTREVKVDADGAPNAYHPDDVGLHCIRGTGFKGLDCPANGGYPNSSWWHTAIVPDPSDPKKGYVQPDGKFKGYFVSQTSLRDKTKSDLDPSKFVDSTTVPYLVMPRSFYAKQGTGSIGDLGFALHLESGKSSPFIVAEVGPKNAHLGEMSIFLGQALGGSNPNPRTGAGGPTGKVVYVMFPRSKGAPAWPVSSEDMHTKTTKLLNSMGGLEVLRECGKNI